MTISLKVGVCLREERECMFMDVHMCMGVCMYVCSIKCVCVCVFISVCRTHTSGVPVHVIYVTVSFVCKHTDGSLNRCGASEHTDSREESRYTIVSRAHRRFWKGTCPTPDSAAP